MESPQILYNLKCLIGTSNIVSKLLTVIFVIFGITEHGIGFKKTNESVI